MSEDVLIKVESVSKKFCRKLKRSMFYGVKDITKDILNLDTNSRSLRRDEFWAVEDVSFEVRRGECLGIIGRNGAGKSTLLKMLNGIYPPDKGKITIKGNVGALIEVGAGFHPMLTGRENIYVNGSILGLNRLEINKKFDEIVAFAELESFIDMPVKHYSSGMYVRLGFAIAAQCRSDVLLLDEVLAVGDLKFRHKCLQYIKKLTNNGVGLILISHSMNDVLRVAHRGLVLSRGEVKYTGDVEESIAIYQSFSKEEVKTTGHDVSSSEINMTDVCMLNKLSEPKNKFSTFDDIWLQFNLSSNSDVQYSSVEVRFLLESPIYGQIATISSLSSAIKISALTQGNQKTYAVCLNRIPLLRGCYVIHANFFNCDDGVFLGNRSNISELYISQSQFSAPHRHLLALERDWYLVDRLKGSVSKVDNNPTMIKQQRDFYG